MAVTSKENRFRHGRQACATTSAVTWRSDGKGAQRLCSQLLEREKAGNRKNLSYQDTFTWYVR